TYQAASGAGMPGLTELTRELKVLAEGGEVGDTSPFAYQLAMNLIPQIGSFKDEGYTSEEWKMQNEGRKIMHLPEVRVNCTCVRVPIMRSHSESITLEFENPLSPDEAREILSTAPGVKVVDDPANLCYPMPLDTSDQDLVFVGRIRRDLSAADGVNGLTFFCCGDQIRKGAATNAVQIADYLV
ncbi:MAG: aspartate-semialdehyde dehydrogenase, partial [Atopobiaceae bacterium]|nr:aspartate-semialdehyde dehydrogenase [Atopobiaceae bacterium]